MSKLTEDFFLSLQIGLRFLTQAGILGTLLGTVIGASLSHFARRQERKQLENGATMLAATYLRHWINLLYEQIIGTITYVDSEGHGGTLSIEIANFRFENALEKICLLQSKRARDIFDLIHKKDSVNASVRAKVEYQTDDEAIDWFRGKSAELCLDAIEIYNSLASATSWPEDALPNEGEERLKCEVERLCTLEIDRVASNREMLKGLNSK